MKIHLETMGCQMNKLDSELVVGALRAAGHEMVDDPAAADVLLYNTCSVRDHAEQKVMSRLGEQARRKRDFARNGGRNIIVGVLGCMAQRLGASLIDKSDGVDLVVGPSQIDRLPAMLGAFGLEASTGAATSAEPCPGVAVAPPRGQRPRDRDAEDNRRLEAFDLARPADSAHAAQAYIRVQRGCDKFCAYCIVPYVRGSEQSRDPDAIVAEARKLADGGVREITLLGQTVNSYRHEAGNTVAGLADLLDRLDPIEGLQRIRFVTSYPADFDEAILQAMRDLPKVCEYLHIPAQSGSDRMLRAMNRRYTASEYIELIDRARETVPGIAIAGDFIVGFSGETEADFLASCDLVRRAGYKNSFIFKYSPREGTVGARTLPDDVPTEEKKRRNNELLAVQNEVSLAHHKATIGSTVEVLVEGPSVRAGKQPRPAPPGQVQLQGRTRGDHIVAFDGPAAWTGTLVNVRITQATALALRGVAESSSDQT